MTTPTPMPDLKLRALRGEPLPAGELIFLIGGPGWEHPDGDLFPTVKQLRVHQGQADMAQQWLRREHEEHLLGAACLALTLSRAAWQWNAIIPAEQEQQITELLARLTLRRDLSPTLSQAAALLNLSDRDTDGLLSLCADLPYLRRPAHAERGWWELRRRAHLASTSPAGEHDTPCTDLARLIIPHDDAELDLMLGTWEVLSASLGEAAPLYDAWTAQLGSDSLSTLGELIPQVRRIFSALDELNPAPLPGSMAWPNRNGEDILAALGRLYVPPRQRQTASGVLLSLWMMTRLSDHWEDFCRPVWEDETSNTRAPELRLARLLGAALKEAEPEPWSERLRDFAQMDRAGYRAWEAQRDSENEYDEDEYEKNERSDGEDT